MATQILLLWFNCNEPFDLAEFRLKSLPTGLVASDKIDCDNAEAVGAAIQNELENICIEDAVIPKKAQVRTLQLMKPGVKIDSKTIHIDPLIFFTRLTALIQRDGKNEGNFKYELTPESTTLFRNEMMRKSGKPVLRKHLLNKYTSCDCPCSRPVVIDEGALIL